MCCVSWLFHPEMLSGEFGISWGMLSAVRVNIFGNELAGPGGNGVL